MPARLHETYCLLPLNAGVTRPAFYALSKPLLANVRLTATVESPLTQSGIKCDPDAVSFTAV